MAAAGPPAVAAGNAHSGTAAGERAPAPRTAAGERWHDLSARLCRDPVTGRRALLITEIDRAFDTLDRRA